MIEVGRVALNKAPSKERLSLRRFTFDPATHDSLYQSARHGSRMGQIGEVNVGSSTFLPKINKDLSGLEIDAER